MLYENAMTDLSWQLELALLYGSIDLNWGGGGWNNVGTYTGNGTFNGVSTTLAFSYQALITVTSGSLTVRMQSDDREFGGSGGEGD